tara:strand:- start:1795 stop:1959 length:165 start_codon:yes stop_codon:yes gene_type:complete
MKLGNKLETLIKIITLGKGKQIATWIALRFGYDDCGCDKRKKYLNNISRNGKAK